MARIKIIKSLDGQQVYPLTRTNAVYTEDNVRLDDYLGAMVEYTQSVEESIPTTVSEMEDAKDYATVDWTTEQLGQLSKLKLQPVDELPPDEEALETIIYLIKDVVDETVYNQMLYNATVGWKQIGTTKADLTEYAKTEEVNTAIDIAVPAGVIMPFAGVNAPEGYFFCKGQQLSKIDYPDLFNAIGYTYGANETDENMFLLPDLRGRSIFGHSQNDTNFGALGTRGGQRTITLSYNNMPAHYHEVDLEHYHTADMTSAGSHYHTGTTNSSYAGSSNYFLTSPSAWESDGGDNVSGSGDKYPKQNNNQACNSTTTSHSHSYTTSTNGSHYHAIDIDNYTGVHLTTIEGENEPFSSLNPYLVMNFIIKY